MLDWSIAKGRLWQLLNYFMVDTGRSENTIILSGSGRSGTTWVEELLNVDNDYRMMFEPFHNGKIAALKRWQYKQYLRPGQSYPMMRPEIERILAGKIRHRWIDKFNRKIFADKRILKDIRANLFLAWLREEFPQIPQLLLLRHPCPVASSQLKLNWPTGIDTYFEQPELIEDHLRPFLDLRDTSDHFERHLVSWCIENYVPLRQLRPGDALVLFYEHICLDPAGEMDRIATFLGRSFSGDIVSAASIPSNMSQADSTILYGAAGPLSWRRSLSAERQETASHLLARFGLNKIYGDDGMPVVDSDSAIGALG
ncbi:hypothetical protein GCM10023219_28910 [Stakelama sediminis]|uniref:Sulfotransferase family protein n=1 Tax=Stakelama sediminis TaxID=463200 RepID=A0A840Z3M2_9SPHN|nr:sulfotransferase [Stakelama sediminis]MBB5720354.1 hypothetical protein [Stakelama sediminis]